LTLVSNNGTTSGDSEPKTAGVTATGRSDLERVLAATKMAMVDITVDIRE